MKKLEYNGIDFYETKYNNYYVSKDGQLLSTKRPNPRILSPKIDKDGYLEYGLSYGGNGVRNVIYKRAHRIVAETFLENPDNKETINHKNGIKNDNRVENLEWATYSENNHHRYDELNAQPPGKIWVSIYDKENNLIDRCGMTEALKYCDREYILAIKNGIIRLKNVFLEKSKEPGYRFIAYWNGEILKKFKKIEEAYEFFNGFKKHSVYAKAMSKQTKTANFCRNYKIIFEQ